MTWREPFAGFLMAAWLAGSTSLAAPEASLLKSALSKPGPASPGETPGQSVETLSDLVRPSVVVISHFGRDGKEDGVGSGFVIATNGLIATSLHVVGEARPISVELADGKRCEVVEIHAWDRKLDLVILRVKESPLPALRLGDSDALKQGAPVVAMGNPLGLQHSVVQGVVSARRDLDGLEMIQLAIPIEPGNSGGPLLDMEGRVHGILTLKSAMTANLGFATPVNALKLLLAKPNPVPIDRWLTLGALPAGEWTPLYGARWRQKAGSIQVEQPGQGFGGRALCLSRLKVPEPPYELGVRVRLDDEAGAAGLAFGADGDQKHYGFYPSNGQLRLTRFDGPDVFSWTILKQLSSPHYHPGEWNELKVRIERERILCFVNGELAIEAEEAVASGTQVGLAKFRETRASFKEFQVAARLTPGRPAVAAATATRLAQALREFDAKTDAEWIAALEPQAEAGQRALAERVRQLENETARLLRLASAVHRQSVQKELVKAFEVPEAQIDLFHAALLVAKLDNPELEIEPYRRQLETMARGLSAQLPAAADGPRKLESLIRYLFTDNGFHGSRTDYYNRANSYISEVLDDREGLPITLSVLFLELAHRIGLPEMAGIPLPGHFVVRYKPAGGEEQWLDVFEGGRRLTLDEVKERVLTYSGVPATEKDFQPATKRQIIVRILRNLSSIAQNAGSSSASLPYLELMLALEPDSAAHRLERARLRLRGGDPAGAREDFKWLLDNAPPGVDLDRIAEIYRSL